ncbi:ATP-grasp domain-containing protein [Microbacterium horticulturae]|uniref:ATP-grasp domain-containing protein n=1 Tax=Microbacterium horticulturae TaxID=3028316 RepID=A0ABY8BYA0_9MICO|nr:ATP-grasp domain-containing protein [Microbacterium sp. KACC 23027]WEG09174.1 ATP-grasp domain-containing protein [Microbacterium sp. KACC 23027]
MTTSPSDTALPVLAIVLDSPLREFFPLTYVEAAAGVCRPLWVTLRDDVETKRYVRILRRSGDVVDVCGRSEEQAAEAIRGHAPGGIVAFYESNVPWTARVAELLRLPYHSVGTAAALSDKWEQRRSLRDHGLRTPGFWDVGELARDEALLGRVAHHAAYPLIAKPRSGRASRDMVRVPGPDALKALVASSGPEPMVVEEFIPDPSTSLTGVDNAYYVSVETLVSHGVVSVLGVTGRHPLVEPFREAGLFFPAEVSDELHDELVDVAAEAVRALGVEFGALHVEVKVTDTGPVVIELNPRPGGSALPDLLEHAFGLNIFQVAMRIALGERVTYRDLPRPEDVGYSVYVLPDMELRRITRVSGLDTLSAIDGVNSVIPKRGAGDDIDPHEGMMEYIVRVAGIASDHDARRRIREQILAQVVVSGHS